MSVKRTRNEVAKEKVINFKLEKEMKISDMIKKGYRRKEVITLFEHLEELGFGEYVRGTRGVGNPTRFTTNEKCPDSFSITFHVFRNRKTKQEKEQECDTPIDDGDSITNLIRSNTKDMKLEPCPSDGKGYAIGTNNNKAFLVRPAKGGFETIEKAVRACWYIFEGKVDTFKSRNMKDFEQVASKLRGLGYVELKGE